MKIERTTQLRQVKHALNSVCVGVLCFVLILLATDFKVFSQDVKKSKKISFEVKQVDLKTVISILEDKSGYSFIYSDERIIPEGKFSFSFKDEPFNSVLDKIFHPQNIDYIISGKYIVLKKGLPKSIPAQRIQLIISGQVLDENNIPIPGASIYIKGDVKGISTDIHGKFTIYAHLKDTLVVSAIGFNSLQGVIGKDEFSNVKLKVDVVNLEEVVVVGYGVQERRDVLGAVSSMRTRDIPISDNSLDDMLGGRMTGVFMGGSTQLFRGSGYVNIRGISSLNPEVNNPLIVVDGVPMFGMGSMLNSYDYIRSNPSIDYSKNTKIDYMFSGLSFERNPISDINIFDIESVEILKDSYATAIYGSRGATGVVLVQTKIGKELKPILNINSGFSISQPVNLPDLLSGDEYSELYSEYYRQKGGEEQYFPKGVNTNWLDKILRTAAGYDFSMTYGGKVDNTSFFLGLSYLNQQSYIKGSNYSRYTARFNSTIDLYEFLSVGSNIGMYWGKNSALADNEIYKNALFKAPNVSVRDSEGNYIYNNGGNTVGTYLANPIAQINKDMADLSDYRLYGNIFAEIKITPWITFKTENGIDWYKGDFINRVHDNPGHVGGEVLVTGSVNNKFVTSNTITLNKSVDNLQINFVGGQSFEKAVEKTRTVWGKGFASDQEKSVEAAQTKKLLTNEKREWALFSLFSRMNLQYDNRYLLGITYRLDGSSRFNKKQRYVGFPSLSLGWRISEMDFMQRNDKITDLKLRASFGYSGIDGSGGYYGNQGRYISESHGLNYGGTDILLLDKPSNPNLKWEVTRTVNLGFDIEVYGGDYSLSFDYYNKYISNLLYESAIAAYKGFSIQLQNIGDMRNEGGEIELKTEHEIGEVGLQSYVNSSYNHNKVVKLNSTGYDYWGISDGLKYFVEGEAAGVFLLYDWVGVDPLTGNSLWKYSDGSVSSVPPAKVTNNSIENKYVAGSPLPKWWGGLGTTINYRNWDFNCHFSYALGNKLFNSTKAILTTYTSQDANNLSTAILDYWKVSGMRTDIPALVNSSNEKLNYNSAYTSDRFLENASYLRLENLMLAFRFDISSKMKKMGIRDLKVYAQINNLFTISGYSGTDPTVSFFGSSSLLAGYDELCLPSVRSYRIGFKIGF